MADQVAVSFSRAFDFVNYITLVIGAYLVFLALYRDVSPPLYTAVFVLVAVYLAGSHVSLSAHTSQRLREETSDAMHSARGDGQSRYRSILNGNESWLVPAVRWHFDECRHVGGIRT